MSGPGAAPHRLRELVLTVLGTGHIPIVPATWASLAALLLYGWLVIGLAWAGAPAWLVDPALPLAGAVAASVLSLAWGEWAIARFGSKDPRPFVLDEFAGQWLALAWLPVAVSGGLAPLAAALTLQFVLFRVFDILKPPPVFQLQRLPGGWGVLADDLMAGVYANLVGQWLWRFAPLGAWLGLE